VKRIFACLPVFLALLVSPRFAAAQSTFDLNVGFGWANAKALPGVDITTLGPCTSATPTGSCAQTPSLNSFMLGFGGNLMAWKHFGVGAEVEFQPKRQDYLTFSQQSATTIGDVLQDRVTLYDFHGVLRPVTSKKAELQLLGGIGGANVKFYEKQTSSSAILGNSNQTFFAGSSNHFQVHGGIGAQFYVSGNFYVRPQFDVHWVNNFTQFGRDTVLGFTVWVGYSLGDRQ
jgi:hypothetical protein